MKYRITCLTPTLIGDGQKLAPIDYMVWKDHVNVLDQRRIFKLLSKGPRLDGYLAQLKKADRLEFASWGGFAQNFAGRRIPFEAPSVIPLWEKAYPENLFIPTFATSLNGPYIPGSAVKGALRTGAVSDRWTEGFFRDLSERLTAEERLPRQPALKAEEAVLGGSGASRMKRFAAADSAPVAHAGMKVYLLRVSTLVAKGGGKFELGWKSQRGSVDARRVDDSTPHFAEMAAEGISFEGFWREKSPADRIKLFQAANRYASKLLAHHKAYAEMAGLVKLGANLDALAARAAETAQRQDACLLSIGWGSGLIGKAAYLETQDESYRKILRQTAVYQRAIQTGLPFPKTRRVVFEGNQPSTLPGLVLLEVSEK
ncbi:MAG TPA: type III-A CRISPR-associated RAMP protein Csm5 [Bryobacteraceae bacterium]|nr:type III-A CRISPR-associated RAMP protein Csm5 [Bryobacteraceae bacterium]